VRYNASLLNRVDVQFTDLRYFALDCTDQASHKEQGRAIRRYLSWRTATLTPRPTQDRRLGEHCLSRH
jgi:hypothetical protein